MNDDEGVEGQRPEQDFEIVEVDVDRYLTDEQRSWPVVECQRPEQEFAIEEPLPALNVRLSGAGARLSALVDVFSDQEAALGGSGLDVARQATHDGTATATLLPRSVEGARGRLERVARWAAAFGSEVAVTVV